MLPFRIIKQTSKNVMDTTFNDKFYPASMYLLLCDLYLLCFQGNCLIFLVNVFCKFLRFLVTIKGFLSKWFTLFVFIICFKCFFKKLQSTDSVWFSFIGESILLKISSKISLLWSGFTRAWHSWSKWVCLSPICSVMRYYGMPWVT